MDAAAVLSLVGLQPQLPPVGQCTSLGEDEAEVAYPLSRVELVDAGDVIVEAGSQRTHLAPNAFPTVPDLISGVLYTSRDRSADPLPASTSYSVQSTGGFGVAPFAVGTNAPSALEEVKLNSSALAEVTDLSVRSPLSIEWRAGAAGDRVYVELSREVSSKRLVCAFRDEDGTGTIPPGVWSRGDDSRIAIHRLRTRAFESPGIDVGELRFDFAVESGVRFTD